MLIRVTDVETSSNDDSAKVIQLGWQDVEEDKPGKWMLWAFPYQTFVALDGEIDPAAKAVHHIEEADLAEAMSFEDALAKWSGDLSPRPDPDVYAAHNAAFEQKFLKTDRPWICTYKVALRLWPDLPSHGNQFLRYYLNSPLSKAAASPPHHAGPDAYVTAFTLMRQLREMTAEEMIKISAEPALIPTIKFGKHRGMKFRDLPADYLSWMLGQDFDEDIKHTARHWLERRG